MDYRNIVQTVYKVSDFASWQRNGSLVISPSFQRRPVWPKAAKSYLLDTIVRGYPIPIIFLRERTDISTLEPLREVVDGQQRLRTIFAFIEPALLDDYEPERDSFTASKSHNDEIAGLSFKELPEEIRRRIIGYEFSVNILPSDTEDREVLQIFARMNSTGVKLNNQELRNAEFIGAFKRFVYTLAYGQLERWRNWGIFSESNIARMLEVEETSELVLLMHDGMHSKRQKALNSLYRKYENEFPFESEVTRRFEIVMDSIDDELGDKLEESPFSRRVLFHTLFTFFYDLMFGLGTDLEERIKPRSAQGPILAAFREASNRIRHSDLPDDLARVLRGGTGNLESRKLRLEFLKGIYEDAKGK